MCLRTNRVSSTTNAVEAGPDVSARVGLWRGTEELSTEGSRAEGADLPHADRSRAGCAGKRACSLASVPHLSVDKTVTRRRRLRGVPTLRTLTWRHGTKKPTAIPPPRCAPGSWPCEYAPPTVTRGSDASLPARVLLLAQWPPGEDEPTNYWLSTLPVDTPLTTLVRLANIRWRIEHDYRELTHGLGLDHFEGRTYQGWHRHVTLGAVAEAFATMLRLDPVPAPA